MIQSRLSMSTHPLCKKHDRGFTLIELLVVLVIVGVLASFITLNFNPRNVGKSVREESQRLALLMQLAADTAIYSRQQLGIRFHPESYEFYILSEAEPAVEEESATAPQPGLEEKTPASATWEPVEDERLAMREPQVPIEFEVEIEGIPIALETLEEELESISGAEVEPLKPHVLMLSNGELMPSFRVVISDSEERKFSYQVYTGEEEPILVEVLE